MDIIKFALGGLQANCYFIVKDDQCLIIDPADEADFILGQVHRRGLEVKALLATHGHFDHVMAVGEIQASLPAPFYLHQEDKFLIKRLKETAKYFLGYELHVLSPTYITSLNVGKMKVGGFRFDVLHTPGHTPGSVCYHFNDSPGPSIVFTGDTLFAGAIGRYDFSYSSKHDLKKSLEKLLKLPENTVVYPGHGSETTIGKEKEVEHPYLEN